MMPAQALSGKEGLHTMQMPAKNMAWILKILKLEKYRN